MRTIINSGGLFVVLTFIILIHVTLISRNMRDMEVHNNLESSADYAMDKMLDMYRAMESDWYDNGNLNYDPSKNDEYATQLISCFYTALNSMMTTDGELNIKVHCLDIKNGNFDFWVEEVYDYGFLERKGQTGCRRLVEFNGAM